KMLKQILHLLQADRVLIYGFNPDGSGEVLSESVTAGWKAAGSSFDKDYFLTKDCQPYYVVNDIYTKGFTRCFIEALEALEAKAYITVPVCYNDELLGVLTVYQNSNPRNWQKSELDLMVKYATQFALPLQRTVYMRHTQFRLEQNEKYLARGRSLNRMLERIRSAKSKENVFQIATQEGRKLMDVDRLAVYRFDSDWSGKFIAESVTPGWTKLIDTMLVVQDTYLQETEGGRYKHGECFAVDDIYTVGHQDCHIELLEQFEARAYLIAPVFGANKKLWGLIAAYQNTGSRKWQQDEIDSLRQIGLQVGIAMEQIEYVENLEKKAEQEETISNLVDRIRGSLKLEQIFRNVTQEVRKVLESDRVVVYRFNPDWSGEVLAESYGTEWVSVMELQETDKSLYSTDMNANERCNLKYLQSGSALDKDTYFVNSQGGDYSRGKKFQVVDDIYKAGFSDCYLRSLEKYQARAYIIVPIFQDSKLWGLFAVYQNSDTRQWKTSELNLMLKVAPQLSIAIQQAEKSEKLKKTLDRQKGLAQMVDRMRDNSSLDKVLEIAAKESCKLLGVERSSIYQFNSDWTGQNVVEAPLDEEFQSMQATYFKTTFAQEPYPYLQKNQGGLYQNGDPYIVNDLSKSGLEERLREVLEKLNIKAYIRMPIFVDQQLWGIINLYQSQTRLWQEDDIEFIKQLASQIGIVIQQINYLEQVKTQSQNLTETLAREKAAKERLQQEAMQMLLSVKPAFSGDLTVRAQVTDNEIGTIAGAFNTTLDSLKDIVVQVQAAAEQVAITTGNSYGAVDKLSGQAQQQFLELSQALHQIQAMVDSTEITTTNATQVGMAISQANQTVQVGDKAMNNTVESINAIRQTVAEAEKRVKRLSESSQKISKVVNLISSFAAQTNLLALNAALEATRAGEYGKGFAVVADEVRNLSLQSSEATSEIEKLVQEIQAETQEVATAMNVGIQQVQEGTNLVKTTRENLNEIVAATNSISQLVEGITLAAEEQAKQAESVTEVVNQVAEIANTTSQDSNNISASFQELLAMAENLQNSVSQFKIK
ncbi:MAG: GAF domain-containing protein, partial [Cyanobacteria bacterium J083]